MVVTFPEADRRSVNHGVLLRRCECDHALGYHDEEGCVTLFRDERGLLTRCTCETRRSVMLDAPMRER